MSWSGPGCAGCGSADAQRISIGNERGVLVLADVQGEPFAKTKLTFGSSKTHLASFCLWWTFQVDPKSPARRPKSGPKSGPPPHSNPPGQAKAAPLRACTAPSRSFTEARSGILASACSVSSWRRGVSPRLLARLDRTGADRWRVLTGLPGEFLSPEDITTKHSADTWANKGRGVKAPEWRFIGTPVSRPWFGGISWILDPTRIPFGS